MGIYTDIEKYAISEDEHKGLLLLFYNALYTLHHCKGLRYRQSFNVLKKIKELGNQAKNIDINKYLCICDDSEVFNEIKFD